MSNINIKDTKTIKAIAEASKMAADLLTAVDDIIKPGISTEYINNFCHKYIIDRGVIPAPLNYKGFPKSICTSVNHVICHGIPTDKQILKDGDIVNVDVTIIKDSCHGDTSKMYLVGNKVAGYAKKLSKVSQECLWLAINRVKNGATFGEIGKVIQQHAEKNGFFVVRDFCGHGIGLNFHEEPQILHYYDADFPTTNVEMKTGMVFTIEPMINEAINPKQILKSKVLQDGWTAVTSDKIFEKKIGRKALSAQWEHTLVVTDSGCEVLTRREEEKDF